MKSSYDLLSIFLDNQDLPKHAPVLISLSEVPECAEVGEDYDIFDLLVCKRKITGMRLLSAMSAEEMSSWADALADCKEIIVVLDYSSVSQIACTLFLKRVLQSITYLSRDHPEIDIILAGDVQKWTEPLKMAYTGRGRNRHGDRQRQADPLRPHHLPQLPRGREPYGQDRLPL